MNAATSFTRDRKFEEEEERLDREFEETLRRERDEREIREGWDFVADYENGLYN
tara:strand:- start:615 stop:776 length:162 start_codon:yes stop_codon:yes gene_type:complete